MVVFADDPPRRVEHYVLVKGELVEWKRHSLLRFRDSAVEVNEELGVEDVAWFFENGT